MISVGTAFAIPNDNFQLIMSERLPSTSYEPNSSVAIREDYNSIAVTHRASMNICRGIKANETASPDLTTNYGE